MDELVGLLRQRLSDPDVERRNRLRAWESRLERIIGRHLADGDGADRRARVSALLDRRDDILRGRRLSKTERAIALRSQIQQARVQLGHFARNRCTSVRSELAEDASRMRRSRFATFEGYVRTRAGEVVDEVEEGISAPPGRDGDRVGTARTPGGCAAARAAASQRRRLQSRRLETQLMMILGAGFGLGVALVVTRLFAGLAPGLTVAGLVAGGVVGLALTVWVVGIRGLLHDRAVLDRWVTDVTGVLRSAVDERVATRVLVAETALTSELAHRDEVDSTDSADRVAEIDSELREHAVETRQSGGGQGSPATDAEASVGGRPDGVVRTAALP